MKRGGRIMKKMFLVLALVFAMSASVFAQRNDGFFNNYDNDVYNRLDPIDIGLYLPSGELGASYSEPAAPLGTGLLILTVLGAGYAVRKRKE